LSRKKNVAAVAAAAFVEYDVPVDSTSDGSAAIDGSAYASKASPIVDPIVGVGFENFSFTRSAPAGIHSTMTGSPPIVTERPRTRRSWKRARVATPPATCGTSPVRAQRRSKNGIVLDGVIVHDIGAEAVHFRKSSSYGVIENK
jgi:hypothetical protein